MLISLHIPKAAGTSFRIALEQKFGSGLLRDYDDRPIHSSPAERNAKALRDCQLNRERSFEGVACIHGHFLPRKYLPLIEKESTRLVTWLRDPVERLASNYRHWKRFGQCDQGSPLVRRFIDQQWSFERFCFADELKDLYSQFLWDFSFARFDFVGITEHYEEDMACFSQRFLDAPAAVYRCNVNPDATGRKYVSDAGLRADIEAFHAKDMALYRQALALRQARLSSASPALLFSSQSCHEVQP
jgi:hypothetical protein